MRKTEKMLVGAGLAVAASGFGLELAGLGGAGYLIGVPVLAGVPAWLTARAGRRAECALHRATAREHVLGELGAALLGTTDPAEIHRHTVRAALALLADTPGADAAIVQAPEAAVPEDAAELLLPFSAGDRSLGALRVSADQDLPTGVRTSLELLRTQAALALSHATTTDELSRRALSDALTGLGNREMLRDRLAAALARSRRTGRPVAALLLDLNNFRRVNDVHGHDAGDRVLCEVADRLRLCVRAEDTVGRLGADEFVVLAEDLHAAKDALVIAERIVAALDDPMPVGGPESGTRSGTRSGTGSRATARATASVGIALSHSGTAGPDDLFRAAGTAMHEAKRRGGGHQLHGATPVPALRSSV